MIRTIIFENIQWNLNEKYLVYKTLFFHSYHFLKTLSLSRETLPFRLREKCPYSEFFRSTFSRIRTRKTPNTDTFHRVLLTPYQTNNKLILTQYHGVRNVCFLENLACFVFLLPPFRDSLFYLITDNSATMLHSF